ncbi:thiosulfate sulfurtransferase GlpE [Halomonas halocynthiae]|uniref:thiosulfate sulfurtransferase GlpE n=1 Tax=Halomonas halocynthiae TaxID=176290 RepID=UPI00040D1E7C|nr:thiosulfate sulfurtransferase GlpE [Halomonas halocynthiae]
MTAPTFQHLDAVTLERWLKDATPVTLVDIRDPSSFAIGHIPTSQHLDNQSVSALMHDAPAEQPVVVVCYHGHSSMQVASWLVAQGFDDVYSLDGGYSEWQLRFPAQVETSR